MSLRLQAGAVVVLVVLVVLQVALFQLMLWAHLAGNWGQVLAYAGVNLALLLGVLGHYVWTVRAPARASAGPHAGGGPHSASPHAAGPAAARPEAAQAPGDQTRALILGTLGFVVTFMVWGSISPLALQFKQLYALTNTQVSLLIAVPVLLGSLGRLPVGMLADRFGPRKVYTLLIAFLILPLAAMGFTRSFPALIGVSFFLGVAGSSFSVGVPFVSRWYPPTRQGLALGIFGAGNFGQALGVLYAPRVAAAFGWPVVYWSLIIPVALTALAIGLLGKDAPKPATAASASGDSIWTSPKAWLLSLFYFVSFGGFVAFSNYLPKLYQELHVLTPGQAGSYVALFVAIATVARPLGGWLSDQISASKVLRAIFAAILVGAALLSGSPSLGLFAAASGILALALGLGNGAVFKLVPQFFPGKTGAVTGMVGAMGGLGGFFPPLAMGMIRDQMGSYTLGFVALAAFAVVSFAGVVRMTRSARIPAARAAVE